MRKSITLFILFIVVAHASFAQKETKIIKWWNPIDTKFPILEGQAWPKEVENFYERFPTRAKNTVREAVWDLSKNSAGMKILFKTDAQEIIVRYKVTNKDYAMNHFPATGVSGLDLYSLNLDGSWAWANGSYSFNDTITYHYTNLDLNNKDYTKGRAYHLYLPLYNSVSWLEIGVPENSSFSVSPPRKEKPIVVYGTSIAQGGCASRPGMAWTALLERSLKIPVVNLGFSANGELESEVIDLVSEIDASVFVLDCMPNLLNRDPEELKSKILASVNSLRKKHPQTPIVLVEHSGFIENRMDAKVRSSLLQSNEILENAYKVLIKAKVKNLYKLSSSEINLGTEDTVDGIHPTDLGMYRYAKAYETCIKSILK